VNTDEWCGYNRFGGRHDRVHVTADHSGPGSNWAIDADGDGVREVHCDTMEGTWIGLRNFLRPFRGGSKWCVSQYVAMFQGGQYANPASASYKLEVRDARGRTILAKSTAVSEFGTFHEAVRLDDGAPVGTYQVTVYRPGCRR
jgi:hypothetical protein